MKHIKETGSPSALRRRDEAEPGVLDATESIRRGLAQALRAEGRPANEVLDELESEDAAR